MPATFQINVAPPDLRHARLVLPHQLRVWAGQVDEVLLTYDVVAPARGRFADTWTEHRAEMDAFLAELAATHANVRIGEVDVSPAARRAVAERFLDGVDDVPLKDSRGGPLYAYLYGLHDARHETVLHADSDMLFGGGSQHWLGEAVALMDAHPEVLACCPLPGPPHPEGLLIDQDPAVPFGTEPYAFALANSFTTRIFVVDRARLVQRTGPWPLRPPVLLRSRLKAAFNRHPPYMMPEQMLSLALHEHGAVRVDFLGSAPGMWTLHPDGRSPNFYAALEEVIRRVEANDMPPEQAGVYDIVAPLVDWSDKPEPTLVQRLRR
jgi:hypothetical protein